MDLRTQLQDSLGRSYTIERELGGGGMSRVFVATETALGRKVVIKVLPPELMQGVSVERFKREIQLAAQLQHAHVLGVLNAGEIDGIPYYMMPFVEGQSLRSRISKSGALPIGETISILRDVAKALTYAHEHGVVHRDIKPDNVLISGGSAVVTDFGIAKAIAAARTDPSRVTITQIGSALGTPAYMAPEQAAADPTTNHRADIYAFGVMAYEMLAGHPPFHGRTPHQLLAAQMSEPPLPIAELRLDAPPLLTELVMRCVEKDPDSRPQTAADLVKVLESVTSGGGHPVMPEILLGGRPRLGRALALWAAAFVGVTIVARAAIIAIGLPDWVFPGAIVVMALGLPVILFTYFVHRGAHQALTMPMVTPGGGSMQHSSFTRLAVKVSPHVSWRRTTMGGVYALGAFAVLIVAFMVLRAFGIGPVGSLFATGALQKNERILVADFRSSGRDTTLGPIVTEAFRTGLGQSQSMMVMPATALRDALRRMQRNVNTPVDAAVAREIATREGIKAYVDGEILSVGGRFALTVRLTETQSGETLAALQENAESERDILSAIDRLTRRLRERAGESFKQIREARPLEQVSTPSLDALRKYVQGTRALSFDGDFDRGKTLLEEAVAIDTAFSMAYRKLAVEYNNRGTDPGRVIEYIEKAYRHRDRLTDAERYLTIAGYYSYGREPDNAKTISAYESLIDMQPTNATALNNAAVQYEFLRQYGRAEELILRAEKAPDAPPVVYGNLGYLGVWLRDTAQAWRAVHALETRSGRNPFSNVGRVQTLAGLGAYDSALTIARAVAASSGDPDTRSGALRMVAGIVGARGRLAEARAALGRAAAIRVEAGRKDAGLAAQLDSAWIDGWLRGDVARARATADRALAAHPLSAIPHLARPYGQLVGVLTLVGRTDRAKTVESLFDRERERVRRPDDTRIRHEMAGDIALAEGRYTDAAREYRLAGQAPSFCLTCLWPREAHAYDLAGQPDSAIALFTRYVDTPDVLTVANPWEQSPATHASYLAATYQRLGELWEQKNDRAKAASYYQKFVELWKDADPELQPKVAEVRRRLARLSGAESR